MPYFCVRLQMVILVDDARKLGRYSCDYPFFMVHAKSHDDAFARALVLGKAQETRYKNIKNQKGPVTVPFPTLRASIRRC